MRLRGGHHMDCTNYITAGVGGLMAVTGAAAFVSPSGCLRLICVPESEASHESSLAYMRYMAATILTMVAALAAGNTDDYAAAGPVILYGNALALLTSIPNLERLGCPKLPLVVLILAQALLATLTCVEVIDKDLTLVITAIWALLNGLQLQILPKMVRPPASSLKVLKAAARPSFTFPLPELFVASSRARSAPVANIPLPLDRIRLFTGSSRISLSPRTQSFVLPGR
jgi:hypothetical protein